MLESGTITVDDVEVIIEAREGGATYCDIALSYGVTSTAIRSICTGKFRSKLLSGEVWSAVREWHGFRE